MTRIRIDFGPGRRFMAALQGGRGPFDRMYRQWAAVYATRIRRRFADEGEGQWPPLAPATIAGRRSGEKNRRAKKGRRDPKSAKTTTRGGASAASVTILRDTSSLFGALTIGAQGNLTRRIRNGIRYGFGGAQHTGKMTFRRLAEVHQRGEGRVPRREILMDPRLYPEVIRRFKEAMRRAFDRSW